MAHHALLSHYSSPPTRSKMVAPSFLTNRPSFLSNPFNRRRSTSPLSADLLLSKSVNPQCHISRLPLDLFDRILELSYVPYENTPSDWPYLPSPEEWTTRCDTLLITSLVSKSWRERSQRVLFDEVRLCDDKSAELWRKSKGTERLGTRKVVVRALSERAVRKVLEKDVGLRELELYFLEEFEVRCLGFKSLSGLKKLVLASSLRTYHAKEVRVPYLFSRTTYRDLVCPQVPFSLTHLWFNTEDLSLPTPLVQSILLSSLSSLNFLVIRGKFGNSSFAMAKTLNSVDTIPELRSLQIDDAPDLLMDGVLFSAVRKCPKLNGIFLEGYSSALIKFVEATARPEGRDQELRVEYCSTDPEEDFPKLQRKLRWMKDQGVGKLTVSIWDSLHWPEKNGFLVHSIEVAEPEESFKTECERLGILYAIEQREEWKRNERDFMPEEEA